MKFRVKKKRKKHFWKVRGTGSALYDWFKFLIEYHAKNVTFMESNMKRAYRYHNLPKNRFKQKQSVDKLKKALQLKCDEMRQGNCVIQPVYCVPKSLKGFPIKTILDDSKRIIESKDNNEEN